MKVEEWLTDLARRSGLLKQVEKYLDEVVRQRREQSETAERAAKREKIVSALDATGLTSKDAERLLRWAEPGLLTADEALRLLDLLHNAVDNVRSGPGVLVEQRQSKRVDFSEKIKHWRDLYDTTASRLDRLQAVKAMRWWPELVDALYRGELEVAKQAKRTRGPGSERPRVRTQSAPERHDGRESDG